MILVGGFDDRSNVIVDLSINSLLIGGDQIWEDIHSGKAVEDSSVLSRFLLISFADLKKWTFHYWFAFPALVLDPPATLVDLRPASQWFSSEEVLKMRILFGNLEANYLG